MYHFVVQGQQESSTNQGIQQDNRDALQHTDRNNISMYALYLCMHQ